MQMKTKKATILQEQGDRIFALDIGTRTVVGVVGEQVEVQGSDNFALTEFVVEPHSKRAMIDGQIEDVRQVSKVVAKVKAGLEELTGIKLAKVSIAAAGRALKTCQTTMEFDISDREVITSDMIKSMEIEAIQKAQSELDSQNDEPTSFYCVGYSVIGYMLDDYKMLSLESHKGKMASIELIATFLPSVVVDGLYSVMALNELEVASLTLEPIAAMNVVVPPEIRAINIALVDIGAGTSDIAISKDGSVSAYAMATTAGDEITEEIIKTYFVDFAAAEGMKLDSTSGKKDFEYRNIFGITEKASVKDFAEKIEPAVEHLANAVCEHIQSANKASPAAVFLVGGGSLITGLAKKVSSKLAIDEKRVAIGNHNMLRSVDTRGRELGAEFITPIGIALTAILNRGYDFSVITVNDEKIRVFDTKKLSVYELLTLAGFKATDIMGRSGRSLNFTVNGKRKIIKGGSFTPSAITVNDESASLNTGVTQGDRVTFTPAVSGENAIVKLGDITEEHSGDITVTVNGEKKPADYMIASFDKVEITVGVAHPDDEPLSTEPRTAEPSSGSITITLNGNKINLNPTPDGTQHKFLELLNHAEIDPSNPITGYTLLLNGREVSFNDPLTDGDDAVIDIMEKAV